MDRVTESQKSFHKHKKHYFGLIRFSDCYFCWMLVQWRRRYEKQTAEYRKSRGYPGHVMRPLEHMKVAKAGK